MSWRPDPPVDGREPRPVGPALDRYLTGLGRPTAATLDVVFSRWEEVVGPGVAAHSRPLSVQGETLVVGVDGPAWATQLRFLSGTLLGRLSELIGDGKLRSLDVRVRPPNLGG
jgi:predicted nucleic acid-binding Zn ribbon protein